jgi:hypothetical protein
LEHARRLTQASGAILERLEPEPICLGAVGNLARWNQDQSTPYRGLVLAQPQLTKSLVCSDLEWDARVDRELCRQLGVGALLAIAVPWRPTGVSVLSVVNAERDSATRTRTR